MSILIFFIILAALVFVHELGHFLIAKAFGVGVDEFGLGFPPRLFSWKPKGGETRYSINLIPFGGFVKIFGETPDDDSISGPDKKRSLVNKPKYAQVLVLLAGIVFNILFAWILISIGFTIGLPSSVSERYEKMVIDPQVIIVEVAPKSPALEAGLEAGDAITFMQSGADEIHSIPSLGGESAGDISTTKIQAFISAHGDKDISILIKRKGAPLLFHVTPKDGVVEGHPAIGIVMDMIGTLKLPFFQAFYEGAFLTKDLTVATAGGITQFLGQVVTGHANFSQVSGPIGIANQVTGARELGLAYLLSFTAFISINLALLNLIPFPALDGGRILFVLIEAATRRPIKVKIANAVNLVGFVLLIILMVVVAYKDILKLMK